jgi:hypothetical protein
MHTLSLHDALPIYEVGEEDLALRAMQVAEEQIKYLTKANKKK